MKLQTFTKKVLSKEFLCATLNYGVEDYSCDFKLAERGEPITDVPKGRAAWERYLADEKVFFFDPAKMSDDDFANLSSSVAVRPFDVTFFVRGRLQPSSDDGTLKGPTLDFNRGTGELSSDFQILSWVDGGKKIEKPRMVALEPTTIVSFFAVESVRWQRRTWRGRKGDVETLQPVAGAERSRLCVADGEISVGGKKVSAPAVVALDTKTEIVVLSDHAMFGQLWA